MRIKNNNKKLFIMTELESDRILDYYMVLTWYVFTHFYATSSFRGISKIRPFKTLKIKSKYWNLYVTNTTNDIFNSLTI